MPRIKLHKLQCIVNDEIDKDEVFLKYEGKKIWPPTGFYKQLDNAESFELNIDIDHHDREAPIVIELWDFDYLSRNDFLGYFQMKIGNDNSGEFSTSMTLQEVGSSASYILHWEING